MHNIKKTGYYTVNHVTESFVERAHYTSAQLPREESEFDRMNIEKEFIGEFPAPFVKKSPVKIGMKFMNIISLPNGCSLLIGSVELVSLLDQTISNLGNLNLANCHIVGISGLDTYYSLNKLETFPDVKKHGIPDFE